MNQSPNANPGQNQAHGPSPDSERKLWLDYLAKLNDRRLQRERASGATSWVVFGATVAILYHFFQLLPRLLEEKVSWASGATIAALGADFTFFIGLCIIFADIYCSGPIERRLFPPLMHRALRIIQSLLGFLLAALIVAHAVVLLVATLPRFVFWTMAILTLIWCANLVYGSVIFAQVFQMARKHKVALPETMVKFPTEGPHLAGGLVFATAGAFLTGTALFSYVRSLSTISPNAWLLEFNAAMQLLAVLLLAIFLFGRVVASASRDIYLRLERDILLEMLPGEEIRRRFILEAVGPRIADWLKSITDELEKNQQGVEDLLKETETACAEIESIDPSYKLEREGRQKRLTQKLVEGVKGFLAQRERLQTQVQQWSKLSGHDRFEVEAVKKYIEMARLKEFRQKYEEVMKRLAKVSERGM